MPQSRSAQKRVRQSQKQRLRNRSVRSMVKTYVSKAEQLIQEKNIDAAKVAVVEAVRSLDKAVQKGIIHQNNAARRKSRLMKKINVGMASVATEPETQQAAEGARAKRAAPRKRATRKKEQFSDTQTNVDSSEQV